MLSEAVQQAKEAVLITEGEPLEEPGPRIEYVNEAFEEMTGYSEEEVLGKTPRILQGEETDPAVIGSLREALEAGEEWQGSAVNYRKDGEPYRVQWNVAPVEGEDGSVEHWVSVQRDVTEEREREERLRFLARALDQVGEKVVITGPSGEIQYANDAFEELTGYSEEEVIGDTPALLNSGKQGRAFYEELWETIQSGETFQGEFVNEKKDGSQYVEDETISPVTGEDGEITHFVSAGRDVTERKRIKRELERQNDLFAQAQKMANVGAWEWDLEAEESFMTDQAFRIHGLSPGAEMTPKRSIGHYHPSDQDQIREAFARATEEGKPYDLELRLVDEDGRQRWVRTQGDPQTEEDEVVRVRGTIQDITRRKEREESLRRQKSLLEQTQKLAGAWEVDLQAGEMSWSEEVYRIHEIEPGTDVSVEEGIEYYAPEARPQIREAFEHLVEEGEPYDLELPLITAEGNHRWVRAVGAPTEEEGGEVAKVAGAFQDITDRKEAEKALREERDLLSRTFQTSPAAIVVLSSEGEMIRASGRAEEVLGLERDEVTGRTYNDPRWKITAPGGGEMPDKELPFARVMATGEPVRGVEHAIEWPDGRRRLLSVSGAPLRSAEGELEGAVFHLEDITERRRNQRALREAKEEAERMNRLKSAFLANMSHEIRTPLTSILGFAEAIGEQVHGSGSAEEIDVAMLSQFSGLIEKSGQRLMETLTSVLDLSKLEAGEMDLSTEPVDLAKEAEETAEEFRPQAKEAGVDLHASLGDAVWAEVDEGGLHIVLRNLLSNAIKYNEAGGEVWVRTRSEENLSVLEVEDTGIGMDPEKTSELFKAFKQESEGVNREYEGTGLGLTLVREVLDRMDGSIEVETEKGEGSRFTVRFPKAKPPEGDDGQ